jgi:outer membrane receptor protein involved in Fe transport
VGFPITFMRTIADDLNTKSYAAFGQVDWQFAEQWSLGLGLRYTYEKKDYFRTTSTFTNILGNADPAYQFDDSDHWSDWTPTITLDYAMNDSVRLYGRLANGFKSGGFNGRANLPADKSAFDPESVWTGEIGAKTIMASGKFQANYALFISKYEDFQARVSVGEGLDLSLPVLNAASLDLWGAEAEFVWVPVEAIQISSQIGYLHSKYGAGGFSGADGVQDAVGIGLLGARWLCQLGQPGWALDRHGRYKERRRHRVQGGGSGVSFRGQYPDSLLWRPQDLYASLGLPLLDWSRMTGSDEQHL